MTSESTTDQKTVVGYDEQDEWGNSIPLIRANLRLTPVERLEQGERAARSLLELKRALKRAD